MKTTGALLPLVTIVVFNILNPVRVVAALDTSAETETEFDYVLKFIDSTIPIIKDGLMDVKSTKDEIRTYMDRLEKLEPQKGNTMEGGSLIAIVLAKSTACMNLIKNTHLLPEKLAGIADTCVQILTTDFEVNKDILMTQQNTPGTSDSGDIVKEIERLRKKITAFKRRQMQIMSLSNALRYESEDIFNISKAVTKIKVKWVLLDALEPLQKMINVDGVDIAQKIKKAGSCSFLKKLLGSLPVKKLGGDALVPTVNPMSDRECLKIMEPLLKRN